jgi:hypothetical protein
MYYKKNKKGLAFWYLLPILMLISFVSLVIVISSEEDGIFDKDFTLLKNLDNIQSFSPKEEVFLETSIDRFLENSKSTFLSEKLIANSKNFDFDEDEFIGCKFRTGSYLYNEKNIKTTDLDKSNAYCLKDFNSNFDNEYSSYIKENVEKRIKDFLSSNKISLESLEVKADSSEEININIKTKDTFQNDKGKVSQTRNYEFKNSNSALGNLISELYASFEGFSDILNKEILLCYQDNPTLQKEEAELFCITEIYNNQLNPEFKEKYEVKIKKNDLFEEVSYFNLNFRIINKKDNNLELEFNSIFENKIPLGILNYNLEEYKFAQNTISLNLKDLENKEIPNKYVIIYSYENFIDKDSYDKYNDLIEMLEQSNLDSKLDDFSEIDNYYHSKKDSEMDLSVIMTPYSNFNDDDEKRLEIFQIYNSQTDSFELLDSDRNIYFLVFAVGKKDNYYTNEDLLEDNLKTISVNNKFGPNPILSQTNIYTGGEIIGSNERFDFTIFNYQMNDISTTSENNPVRYDLYVFKSSEIESLDETGCSSYSSSICEKISSPDIENLNGKFSVTSRTLSQDEVVDIKYIFQLNSLILEENTRYNFLLIPINSQGIGNLITKSQQFEYASRTIGEDSNKQSYYVKIPNSDNSPRVTTFSVQMD